MSESAFIPAKPCPKCGNPRVSFQSCFSGPVLKMYCRECGYEGKEFLCPVCKSMVEDWNALDRSQMPEWSQREEEKPTGFWSKLFGSSKR